jgi:hypothetical protein
MMVCSTVDKKGVSSVAATVGNWVANWAGWRENTKAAWKVVSKAYCWDGRTAAWKVGCLVYAKADWWVSLMAVMTASR